MKRLTFIFMLIVISGAFGALVVGNIRENHLPAGSTVPDVTASSTWHLVGELLDAAPGLDMGGNTTLTENQLNAALKEAVLLTSGNADEGTDLAGFEEMGEGALEHTLDNKIYGEIAIDEANLPEFMRNMTPEQRQQFVKFFRGAVMKEVDRARKQAEKKALEEKRKKAIRKVQRRMRFTRDETDYMQRQEQECWNRIKEIAKSAKVNKTRKGLVRREITAVRKQYREELDEVLGENRYTKYLDQVHRTVDPAYRNQADIASLRKQVDSMRKTMQSLQRQISNAMRQNRSRKPAQKR